VGRGSNSAVPRCRFARVMERDALLRISNRTGSASDRSCRFRLAGFGPALALGVLIDALILMFAT